MLVRMQNTCNSRKLLAEVYMQNRFAISDPAFLLLDICPTEVCMYIYMNIYI